MEGVKCAGLPIMPPAYHHEEASELCTDKSDGPAPLQARGRCVHHLDSDHRTVFHFTSPQSVLNEFKHIEGGGSISGSGLYTVSCWHGGVPAVIQE